MIGHEEFRLTLAVPLEGPPPNSRNVEIKRMVRNRAVHKDVVDTFTGGVGIGRDRFIAEEVTRSNQVRHLGSKGRGRLALREDAADRIESWRLFAPIGVAGLGVRAGTARRFSGIDLGKHIQIVPVIKNEAGDAVEGVRVEGVDQAGHFGGWDVEIAYDHCNVRSHMLVSHELGQFRQLGGSYLAFLLISRFTTKNRTQPSGHIATIVEMCRVQLHKTNSHIDQGSLDSLPSPQVGIYCPSEIASSRGIACDASALVCVSPAVADAECRAE